MAKHAPPSPRAGQDHTRVQKSVLSVLERRALLWIAARTPAWVTPDTYTGVGIVASAVILLGYALTALDKGYLWLASAGFFLHWLGDSMDGTLARYRKIERPRYGFFVDHILDVVGVTLIFIGLGLSPFMRFDVAMMALVAFLLVTIYVYLTTAVNGVFTISYAGLGPTETRVLAVLANTVFFFVDIPSLRVFGYEVTFLEIVAGIVGIGCGAIFIIASVRTARGLSHADRAALREKLSRGKVGRT